MSSVKATSKQEEDSDDFDSDEFSFSNLYTNAGRHVAELQKKLKDDLLKKLRESSDDDDKLDLETSPPPIKVTKSFEIEELATVVAPSQNSTEPEVIEPIPNVPDQVGRRTRSQVANARSRGRGRGRARGGVTRNEWCDNSNPNSNDDFADADLDATTPTPGRKSKRISQAKKSTTIKLLPRPKMFEAGAIEVSDDSDQDISLLVEEDPNWEVSVKVCWRFKDIHKFKIRKFQKLTSVFEYFSKLENVPQKEIQLMLDDNLIEPSDTPDSLQLSIANIIDGGVVWVRPVEAAPSLRPQSPLDRDSIHLKVCTKDSKEPLVVKLRLAEKMKVLMSKVSEELGKPLDKLKFSFDGETLNPNKTPKDLDLEGGEIIDLRIL